MIALSMLIVGSFIIAISEDESNSYSQEINLYHFQDRNNRDPLLDASSSVKSSQKKRKGKKLKV